MHALHERSLPRLEISLSTTRANHHSLLGTVTKCFLFVNNYGESVTMRVNAYDEFVIQETILEQPDLLLRGRHRGL